MVLANLLMIRFYLLLLFAALPVACHDRPKKVEIWIENASDPGKVVSFSSYMGDSLVDRRKVGRDSVAGRIASFMVEVPLPLDRTRPSGRSQFRFVADSNRGEVDCMVNLDSIGAEAFIHVFFVDRTVLAVGMGMDSVVVDKGFGCRVYYH